MVCTLVRCPNRLNELNLYYLSYHIISYHRNITRIDTLEWDAFFVKTAAAAATICRTCVNYTAMLQFFSWCFTVSAAVAVTCMIGWSETVRQRGCDGSARKAWRSSTRRRSHGSKGGCWVCCILICLPVCVFLSCEKCVCSFARTGGRLVSRKPFSI